MADLVRCTDRPDDATAELCRRCRRRPGRERFYCPNPTGFSVAGAQMKLSMKRTIGCDECWSEFTAATRETPDA